MNNAIQRADSNGTGVSLTPTLQDTLKLGEVFAKSGYFTDAREASQAVVKILAGAELGLPAMSAMSGIYIVQGRPTLSANLMAALVKRSGRYNYRVTEHSDKACTILYFECLGGNWEQIGESRFTIEDARRAKTKNIDTFPRNMLFARAMSNGVRWYCPDVTSGPTYTPDELSEGIEAEPIQGSYTEAPASPVAVVESMAGPLASPEQREQIKRLLDEAFSDRKEQGKFFTSIVGTKSFGAMTQSEYMDLGFALKEKLDPSMQQQPLTGGVDTETGEIFEEEDIFSREHAEKKQREELLSAIADLEAAAEQGGGYDGPAYRKALGLPPSLSLCSDDHLLKLKNNLVAFLRDDSLLGDEAPAAAQKTDLRAVRG